MMLLNAFQSTPFKTLIFLCLSFFIACSPADDDLNNGGDGNDTDNEWSVEACLSAPETSTIVGNPISFSSCNEPVGEYRWSINGDVVSTDEAFSWAFSMPGNFMLELMIGDGSGKTSITTVNISVTEATDLFMKVDIPSTVTRQSIGLKVAGSDDLFLFTENQDEAKIALTNYDFNLDLKWKTNIASLSWNAGLSSFVTVNNGWLINTTETVDEDSYLNKWIAIDANGAVQTESLTNVFYHKVVQLDNNEFLAIGNKLVVLNNGQVGVQAILDHYNGDLSLIKSAKLHTQAASSFGSDVVVKNGVYHVLSFVKQSNGKWQANYQNLLNLGPVTTSTPLQVEVSNQAAINNINPEILVAGDQIFIRANQQLFLPLGNGEVQLLPYTKVEKLLSWNDDVLILTNSAVILANNAGSQLWSRHLPEGTTTGATLMNNQMIFDRNVNGEYNRIYLVGINAEGVFSEY